MDLLYVSRSCHHCHRVDRFIATLPAFARARITYRDVGEPTALNELLSEGFQSTPLLVTDARGARERFLGAPDIIQILSQRYGNHGSRS